jgi:hypothetical protein
MEKEDSKGNPGQVNDTGLTFVYSRDTTCTSSPFEVFTKLLR